MMETVKAKSMVKRRVVVTGASKGIGRAVSNRFAPSGHEPVGLARIAPSGFPGRFHEVDLSDRAAAAETLDTIVAGGRIDAVVNNVGFARLARIGAIDRDDLFITYDMNVRTAVQMVLPGMIEAGWGRIVNMASLTTLGAAESSPYAAAKFALET
jgi:NAD(P)-dependent dehydrogenase (short-subunit alcohol dehydrogenase family)